MIWDGASPNIRSSKLKGTPPNGIFFPGTKAVIRPLSTGGWWLIIPFIKDSFHEDSEKWFNTTGAEKQHHSASRKGRGVRMCEGMVDM